MKQSRVHLRGFGSMNKKRLKKIASKGGINGHKNGAHEWTSKEAKLAGAKGGAITSKNREFMVEIGRRGGLANSNSNQK